MMLLFKLTILSSLRKSMIGKNPGYLAGGGLEGNMEGIRRIVVYQGIAIQTSSGQSFF